MNYNTELFEFQVTLGALVVLLGVAVVGGVIEPISWLYAVGIVLAVLAAATIWAWVCGPKDGP